MRLNYHEQAPGARDSTGAVFITLQVKMQWPKGAAETIIQPSPLDELYIGALRQSLADTLKPVLILREVWAGTASVTAPAGSAENGRAVGLTEGN